MQQNKDRKKQRSENGDNMEPLRKNNNKFTVVSHQALLDVADICKKVADSRDLEQ